MEELLAFDPPLPVSDVERLDVGSGHVRSGERRPRTPSSLTSSAPASSTAPPGATRLQRGSPRSATRSPGCAEATEPTRTSSTPPRGTGERPGNARRARLGRPSRDRARAAPSRAFAAAAEEGLERLSGCRDRAAPDRRDSTRLHRVSGAVLAALRRGRPARRRPGEGPRRNRVRESSRTPARSGCSIRRALASRFDPRLYPERWRHAPADLAGRGAWAEIGRRRVRVAAPADLLLSACATSFAMGEQELRFLADAWFLLAGGVDWDRVTAHAVGARVAVPAATALRELATLTGAGAPAGVLESLDRRGPERRPSASPSAARGSPGASESERDELEALDVDEPAIGDLQRRDHRERQERQHLDRLREGHAERPTAAPMLPAGRRAPRRAGGRRAARRPAAAARPARGRRRRRRGRRRARAAGGQRQHRVRRRRRRRSMLWPSCATVEPNAPRRARSRGRSRGRRGRSRDGARRRRSSRDRGRVGDRQPVDRGELVRRARR